MAKIPKYIYVCNECGEMFKFPKVYSIKTKDYTEWFLGCPVCRSRDIELVKTYEGEIVYEKKGLEKFL